MKLYLYALLLPILLVGCKKHDFEPTAQIKELVGKWRLDAVEKTVNGQTVWEKANDTPPAYLVFRFDGVMFDGKGLPLCCVPNSYLINGVKFEVKPKVEVPRNPTCDLLNCIICEREFTLDKDELIVFYDCGQYSFRSKYVRD